MGALRIIGIVLLTIVFIPILISSNLITTINFSYGYDTLSSNIKPLIISTISEQSQNFSEQKINQGLIEICSMKNNVTIQNYTIPCSEIKSDNALDDVFSYLFSEIYYKKYNCNFMECYNEKNIPFILLSEKTDENINEIFLISLGIILIFLTSYFFLFKKRKYFLFSAGVTFLLFSPVSIFLKRIFINMDYKEFGLTENIPLSNVINIFFSKAGNVFWVWFLIGLAFLSASIFLKFEEKNHNS